MARLSPGCRRAGHGAGGRAFRVLRAVCAGAYPNDQRPEGQKGRHLGPRLRQVLVPRIMAAYVGLDPDTDINWVTSPTVRPADLFEAGKVDAFLGFPPESLELRAREIGRVIVNTTTDKPWSQYFCCPVFGNREFVRDHPIATKRYLRAILMAADICATEPEQAARRQVDAGFTPRYDYALQTLTELPYDRWREFDPEDALRFYALRLREVGMINSTPHADHRRGHRLALPERAQARAEGVRRRACSDRGGEPTLRVLVLVLAALILAPLGAQAADLVVWWEKGFTPRRIRRSVSYRRLRGEDGKQVELVRHDVISDVACSGGARGRAAARLPVRPIAEHVIPRWAYEDRLVDLTDVIGPFKDLFDPDVFELATLLNGRDSGHGLTRCRWAATPTTSTSGRACWSRRASPLPTFQRSGRRSGRSGATRSSPPCARPWDARTSMASGCRCRSARRHRDGTTSSSRWPTPRAGRARWLPPVEEPATRAIIQALERYTAIYKTAARRPTQWIGRGRQQPGFSRATGRDDDQTPRWRARTS